jgi:hypothetical protein
MVWAPEFFEFPDWAAGADLMFADAAGWSRPIRIAHGAGGHAAAPDVGVAARTAAVRRPVFAQIGRPTIRATDRGDEAPVGEFGGQSPFLFPVTERCLNVLHRLNGPRVAVDFDQMAILE